MALISKAVTQHSERNQAANNFDIPLSVPEDIAYTPSPQSVLATAIGIDSEDQQLSFKGEIELLRITETNTLELVDLDLVLEIPRTRFSYARSDTESSSFPVNKGDMIVAADYPYSQLLTTISRFKKHNSDVGRFQTQLADVLTKKAPCSDQEIATLVLAYLDERPYDAWETQPKRLTASIMPIPLRSELGERTRQVTVRHNTTKTDTLEPGWVFGVVANYDECYWSLYLSLTPFVELAELGKLHLNDHRIRKAGKPYSPLEIPDSLKGMADTLAKISIKQALAGPPDFSKWVSEHGNAVSTYAEYLFRQHFSRMEQRYFRARV